MTVEVDDTVERYTISGTGPYAFSFRIFDADDLAVKAIDSDGAPTTLVKDTHYTVPNASVNDEDGGTISLIAAAATAYAAHTLDIRSNAPIEQPTSLEDQGTFRLQAIEAALDRQTRQLQDVRRLVKSCLRLQDIGTFDAELSPIANWLSKYVYINASGEPEPAAGISSVTLTRSVIGGLLTPQIPAEQSAGVTPTDYAFGPYPYNLARIGLVPNSTSARTANTTALKALLDPTETGVKGRIFFPNTTGADTYYFNNIIPIRDGIWMDLNGCALHFTKTAVSSDTGSGFIWPIRDFVIENGSIEVDYDMNGVSTSAGYALKFGGRGDDNTTYRPGLWDSLLASPMGNITVRNVRIASNVADASGGLIAMTGGLKGVTLDHVFGSGAYNGVVYEFGWATSGTTNLRQTSHMSEFKMTNCRIEDLNASAGIAVILGGAYNYEIDNLFVRSAASIVAATPGESLFYRPWAGMDDGCKKGRQVIRNIVGLDISGVPITLTGAQLASGGYLSAIIAALPTAVERYAAQTDLVQYVLDGFYFESTSGILCSAPCVIRNGEIKGASLVLTDESVDFLIEKVKVTGAATGGLRLNGGSAIWSPIRQKVGTIRNCFVAGNSVSSAGANPGMEIGNSAAVNIFGNRFNYEIAHDGVDETTQGNAFQLAATASGCVFDSNYVGALVGGTYAYSNVSTPAANGNTIINPQGSQTVNRAWLSDYEGVSADQGDANKTLTVGSNHKTMRWATTLTANRTVTLSTTGARQGDRFRIVRTGLGSFTLDVGGLKTIGSATAAFVDAEYNGSAWVLSGYGAL
jgi:hypothetical protein